MAYVTPNYNNNSDFSAYVNNTPDTPLTPTPNNEYMMSPPCKTVYTTPCEFITGTISFCFFFVGTGASVTMVIIGITSGEIVLMFVGLFPLIFAVVGTVIGSISSIYYKITIDPISKMITINVKKMCCCFNKTIEIGMGEVQEVIVKTDPSTSYTINGVYYKAFEVLFKLIDGRIIKGCTGIINKGGEAKKAFSIIRNGFPSNIPFSGDLVY